MKSKWGKGGGGGRHRNGSTGQCETNRCSKCKQLDVDVLVVGLVLKYDTLLNTPYFIPFRLYIESMTIFFKDSLKISLLVTAPSMCLTIRIFRHYLSRILSLTPLTNDGSIIARKNFCSFWHGAIYKANCLKGTSNKKVKAASLKYGTQWMRIRNKFSKRSRKCETTNRPFSCIQICGNKQKKNREKNTKNIVRVCT